MSLGKYEDQIKVLPKNPLLNAAKAQAAKKDYCGMNLKFIRILGL